MLHDELIISVMLCYYQAMLVNVYVLRLNTSFQQIKMRTRNQKSEIIHGILISFVGVLHN